MRKVVVTGASGRVGRVFWPAMADKYSLRLVGRVVERIGDPGPHEVMAADLVDLEACRRVCEGMDTVVHLAADSSGQDGFYASLLDQNIIAMFNMFRAAKDAGCRRFVFASTIQVIEGYPLDVQARPEMPPKPMNMYAASKVFGEATAHYFAYAEGLSTIVVRVGVFEGNRSEEEWKGKQDGRTLSAFISKRDMCQLLERCIEVEGVQYALLQAVSDNRFKRMDITSTRADVGYEPLDDAFQLFSTGIPDRERWYVENPQRRKEQSR